MESLHYLLMKTNSIVSRGIMREASQMGLTSGQPKILEFLREAQEADQKTIAEHCEIEQATAGSILKMCIRDSRNIPQRLQAES